MLAIRLVSMAPALLAAVLMALLVAPGVDARKPNEPGRPSRKARQAEASEAAAGAAALRKELETLVAQLADEAARNEARARIIAIGKDATPYLVMRMKDSDFTIRWELANVQGDIRDPRAVPALVENVLHDEDPHVRWRSLWALNEYPDDTETLRLLRRALDGDDTTARWNAAVGLSMFDAPDCLPAIHAGLSQPDEWRRWEAINALSRIHDASSAAHLKPLALRGNVHERGEAVMSLGFVGGEQAVDILVAALGDPEQGVRWRACMQLGVIGDRRAVPALEALKLTETDPMVLDHLHRVLGELSPPTSTSPPDGPGPE